MALGNRPCPCCGERLGPRQISRHRRRLRLQLEHDIELAEQEEANAANPEAPGHDNAAPGNANLPPNEAQPPPEADLGGAGGEEAMDEGDDFGTQIQCNIR
jgi:hypothetical protein